MSNNKLVPPPGELNAVDIVESMMNRVSLSVQAWFNFNQDIKWSRADAEKSPLAGSLRIVLDHKNIHKDVVGDHVIRVCAALRYFSLPACLGAMGAPVFGDEFYKTPLGHSLLEAEVYADDDSLVPASEAAKLAKMSISSMSQYISRGALVGYPDPVLPNRVFVRRKALMEFIAGRKTKARKRSPRALDKRPK